jgi:hypothetical protein
VQFGGSLLQGATGIEIWSCGVRVVADAATGGFLPDLETYLGNLVTSLSSWFSTSGNGMSTESRLEWIKANNINGDGSYNEAITHSRDITPVVGGQTNVNGVPQFCSVAMTFETGAVRGYAHRGRIYPPNFGYKSTGGFLSTTDRTSVINSGKALLAAINVISNGPTFKAQPAVVSKTNAWKLITGVSVDNVYDVQRRRKNRVLSVRAASNWP